MLKSIQLYFNSDDKSLDLKNKVYLEDFYDESSGGPYENLQVLTLSISFDNGTPAENESLYTRAVQNLKKMVPNLKAIYFHGGYVYNPIDDNAETLRNELADLRNHFDSLSNIFKSQQLPVAGVSFKCTQVFGQYSVNESFYSELINELFGHKMTAKEVQAYSTSFNYTPNDVVFQIQLSFNVSETTHDDEPKNRRRCFLVDNLYNNVETC